MKLPVCPHCHTIYRYRDVKKELSIKSHKCYNCGKEFKVSRKKVLILFSIIALLCAILDVLELYMVEYLNFTAIMVTNIIIILAGIALIPYFISFKATKKPPPDISKAIDTKNYNKK